MEDILKAILAAIIFAVFMLPFNFIIMGLWNWLMPIIFGLPTITFWQCYGLMWLIRLLTPISLKSSKE